MRPRNPDGRKLTKIAIRLWADDLNYVREAYPANYNFQLREAVARWIERDKRTSKND